jgi:aldehyde dehydrogenase (NAD+)
VSWRLRQLTGLLRFLSECEAEICDALATDLGKPRLEAYTAEIAYLDGELRMTKSHLERWMKPDRVSTPLVLQPGASRIYKEPLGVVLIIAPWNYPCQLAIGPLIGAIAAGNCAILKPSEIASATSSLLARRLPDYVDSDAIKVIEGGIPETTALLAERFDHIFYTGNGQVGRIVMRAAAEYLTPVTLELGGKSPCILDSSADVELACHRIAWGKFSNAGQTCVAPDYVMVHRDIHDAFVERLQEVLKAFYGDDPQKSPDYGRVVNVRHHRRLTALLEGQTVVCGGQHDEDDRYLAPTVLRDVSPDSAVMQDEIFGPILPVIAIDCIDDAIEFVLGRPKPLALYVFARNRVVAKSVLERTSSGGAVINHAWMHLANHNLPFGGVGESGMGAYHGRSTFDTFSHHKSVLDATRIDPPLLYPPYSPAKERWIKRLI